jgi:hypothetical protein
MQLEVTQQTARHFTLDSGTTSKEEEEELNGWMLMETCVEELELFPTQYTNTTCSFEAVFGLIQASNNVTESFAT